MGRRAAAASLLSWSLVAALLVLGGPASAFAQGATPGAAGTEIETLFETSLDPFPDAPVPAALARITFDPGAGLSMTANPGPALHYVEEGGFSVLAAAPMTLVRAATMGTPAPPAPLATGTEFTISPGDLLVIPANAPFEVFNTGAEPAVALIIEFFGRDPDAALPPGIALVPLVVGEATALPPGPIAVALTRLTVESGARTPVSSEAATFAYVETGTAGYTVDEGAAQVLAEATPGAGAADLVAATPGAEAVVQAEGAFVVQVGTVSEVVNTDDDPLAFLALVVSPATLAAGTPAP